MPELERILQNTAGTISQQWYEDGVAVDPGTVTVTITRADGTPVVTAAATTGTGTGARSYAVSTAQTAQLDRLTLTWASTSKGTLTGYLEVVGGFLFSLADMRALEPLNNTTKYPTATLIATRTLAEQAFEDVAGVAFVPRYTRETVQGGYSHTDLLLSWQRVTAVRSVSIDGVAMDLSNVQVRPDGRLNLYLGWTAYTVFPFINAVTVGYEHGYPVTPARVARAVLLLARSWLMSGPIDDRASTFTSVDGGTYSLVTPGRGGSVFGIPEVDATVQQYGAPAGVF